MLGSQEPLTNYRIRGNSLTDKNWLPKRIATDCIKENQRRRITGEKELLLHEYEEIYFNNLPLLQKLNKLRGILALHYMRKAGQNWLNRDVFLAVFFGGLVILLDPQAIINKLKWMNHQKKLNKVK